MADLDCGIGHVSLLRMSPSVWRLARVRRGLTRGQASYCRIRSLPHYDIAFHFTKAHFTMYLVPIAWMYVVLMMTIAEALSSQGTVLGAFFTFVLYGLLPLSIVLYLMGTPTRRRARRAAQETEEAAANAAQAGTPAASGAAAIEPDSSSQAPGHALAPERKEP